MNKKICFEVGVVISSLFCGSTLALAMQEIPVRETLKGGFNMLETPESSRPGSPFVPLGGALQDGRSLVVPGYSGTEKRRVMKAVDPKAKGDKETNHDRDEAELILRPHDLEKIYVEYLSSRPDVSLHVTDYGDRKKEKARDTVNHFFGERELDAQTEALNFAFALEADGLPSDSRLSLTIKDLLKNKASHLESKSVVPQTYDLLIQMKELFAKNSVIGTPDRIEKLKALTSKLETVGLMLDLKKLGDHEPDKYKDPIALMLDLLEELGADHTNDHGDKQLNDTLSRFSAKYPYIAIMWNKYRNHFETIAQYKGGHRRTFMPKLVRPAEFITLLFDGFQRGHFNKRKIKAIHTMDSILKGYFIVSDVRLGQWMRVIIDAHHARTLIDISQHLNFTSSDVLRSVFSWYERTGSNFSTSILHRALLIEVPAAHKAALNFTERYRDQVRSNEPMPKLEEPKKGTSIASAARSRVSTRISRGSLGSVELSLSFFEQLRAEVEKRRKEEEGKTVPASTELKSNPSSPSLAVTSPGVDAVPLERVDFTFFTSPYDGAIPDPQARPFGVSKSLFEGGRDPISELAKSLKQLEEKLDARLDDLMKKLQIEQRIQSTGNVEQAGVDFFNAFASAYGQRLLGKVKHLPIDDDEMQADIRLSELSEAYFGSTGKRSAEQLENWINALNIFLYKDPKSGGILPDLMGINDFFVEYQHFDATRPLADAPKDANSKRIGLPYPRFLLALMFARERGFLKDLMDGEAKAPASHSERNEQIKQQYDRLREIAFTLTADPTLKGLEQIVPAEQSPAFLEGAAALLSPVKPSLRTTQIVKPNPEGSRVVVGQKPTVYGGAYDKTFKPASDCETKNVAGTPISNDTLAVMTPPTSSSSSMSPSSKKPEKPRRQHRRDPQPSITDFDSESIKSDK